MIAAETSVFQLAALVRLPFAVTADLFREDAPLPGYAGPTSDNGSRDDAAGGGKDAGENDDCGYSLSIQGKNAGFDQRTGNYGGTAVSAAAFPAQGDGGLPLNTGFFWLGFKYLFLLACLLALLKSTLPWEIRDACV